MRSLRILAISLALVASLLTSTRSYALDSDTRAVIKTSTYGLLGGAALGAVVLPLTEGGARSVFIGASVGLYIGIIAGIYYITHKDDPDVPFRAMLDEKRPGENPSPFKDQPKAIAKLELPVLKF